MERRAQQGIWHGWYWRFVSVTVIVLAILEIVAFYLSKGKYSFIMSGEFAMFVSALLVVQRAKQHRTLNVLIAVLATYIINLIFQLTLDYGGSMHYGVRSFIQQNAVIGFIGILFCVIYARTTAWSDKRRRQVDEKRREKQATTEETHEVVQQRVHRVKKKRGRGKRN